MEYHLGDRVIVRDDLEEGRDYDHTTFCSGMFEFLGEVVTICEIRHDQYGAYYRIEEDCGEDCWCGEMFVGLEIDPVSIDVSDIL